MTLNRLMLPTRLPHRCEIRTGDQQATRGGRTRPNRLEHFRITGPRDICEAVAARYGGEPREWDGAPTPGAWEVYTTTDTLPVAVPINMPDLLDGPMWELWTGGGRVRRCDGQTCETTRVQGDQAVTETVPCMCNPDAPECKATTRLRVLITGVPGIGTDRLVTHSIHAAMEIPGVIQLAREMGLTGLVPGFLRLKTKTVKRVGQPTNTFPVVTLDIPLDITDYVTAPAGRQHLEAPAPDQQALESGRPVDGEGVETPRDTHNRIRDALIADYGKDAVKHQWELMGSPLLTDENAPELRGRLREQARMPRLDPDDAVDGEVEVHPDQETLG